MQFCAAVAEGLSQPQKQLPCRFFYDDAGSQLFERICQLPEYYPTRTERAILRQHADGIVSAAHSSQPELPLSIVEFGSGSSDKTRLLLEAALKQQATLHYTAIDISGDFLRASCLDLLGAYPALSITGLATEYGDALRVLPETEGPRLFLFLGSNIGNFTGEEATGFLARLRAVMRREDRLLLGIDLVKDRTVLEAAYNDPAGVTAQFNKNLLRRINLELGANFRPDDFQHHAPFVEDQSRIEMRLVSALDQEVTIDAVETTYRFAAGEIVHTENSHKYTLDSAARLCQPAGLRIQSRWKDERDWFAELLLRPSACYGEGNL